MTAIRRKTKPNFSSPKKSGQYSQADEEWGLEKKGKGFW